MGSGVTGNYHGTYGSDTSQPYRSTYGVTPDMKDYDIRTGVYHDGHYDKNPTANNINNLINGQYIRNKRTNGSFTYVIDEKDNLIIGKRNGNGSKGARTPHPTLVGGSNPKVKMAGMVEIRSGKIYSYDNQSGHFKPNEKSMKIADKIFNKLPKKVFHRNFKKGDIL